MWVCNLTLGVNDIFQISRYDVVGLTSDNNKPDHKLSLRSK